MHSSYFIGLVSELTDLTNVVKDGGDERARTRHTSRNKLLVRDRIGTLLDHGSPFLELSQLAGHELYEKESVPAGGIVTGKVTLSWWFHVNHRLLVIETLCGKSLILITRSIKKIF